MKLKLKLKKKILLPKEFKNSSKILIFGNPNNPNI
jgi:hypothetical protein